MLIVLIKYLDLKQIIYRIIYLFPRLNLYSFKYLNVYVRSEFRYTHVNLVYLKSIKDNRIFTFLNYRIESELDKVWSLNSLPKLWKYNLHYLNDLKCVDTPFCIEQYQTLVQSWIEHNPPYYSIGWEPYPLSIRIVNLIKWSAYSGLQNTEISQSIAAQVNCLENNIEYHIGGNHLIANAKALIFAGCFFQGLNAEKWHKKGTRILMRELQKQILSDGGHYERSPMYHALVLEDLLDLKNLTLNNQCLFEECNKFLDILSNVIDKMLFWLNSMTHPDGEIPFFNDAAFLVALSPQDINSYAKHLGQNIQPVPNGIIHLQQSGYVRLKLGKFTLFVDVAPVGPDNLPAHAHADTLSYELSVGKRRIIVNSGTSVYENSNLRDYQRSTQAHSTVEIDGVNSSEVWGSFRVARRAKVFGLQIVTSKDDILIMASHQGYKTLKNPCFHKRTWHITKKHLEIIDEISGNFTNAISRHFLHPDVSVYEWHKFERKIDLGSVIIESYENVLFDKRTHWFPQFGVKIPNKCIVSLLNSQSSSNRLQIRFSC